MWQTAPRCTYTRCSINVRGLSLGTVASVETAKQIATFELLAAARCVRPAGLARRVSMATATAAIDQWTRQSVAETRSTCAQQPPMISFAFSTNAAASRRPTSVFALGCEDRLWGMACRLFSKYRTPKMCPTDTYLTSIYILAVLTHDSCVGPHGGRFRTFD